MKALPLALLQPRNEYRLISLMLLLLHGAVWSEMGGALSRSLMLAHLGLFLVWQPFINRERRLAWRSAAVYFVAALVFVAWLNWWLMVFWVLLLAGLAGGRILTTRRDRYAYMLVLVFLVSELLLGCIPQMFSIEFRTRGVHDWFAPGLVVIPLVLLFIPGSQRGSTGPLAMDFLYGLVVSLLMGILALGGLLGMYATGADYPVALLQALMGLALFLLAISWLWMPVAGFSGLGQVWERYLLNIGTPFEQWLGELARLAESRQQPEHFLHAAMEQLTTLPWVSGVTWNTPTGSGECGLLSEEVFRVTAGALQTVIHTPRPPATALVLHARLLVQLVAHFHNEKRREQELTQRAHLQAIYETGARVTHDIKNLLQSMHTMSSAIEQAEGEHKADAQRMLERQLPHLTQRLRMALDKLQAPEPTSPELTPAGEWWASLKTRNAGFPLRFEEQLQGEAQVPLECFDSVAANLIENALAKRLEQPGIDIEVRLEAGSAGVSLRVCDSGRPVHARLAGELFRGPVRSRTGLGIGLYQAARQADQLGYRLALVSNVPGDVCFELARHSAPADGPAD